MRTTGARSISAPCSACTLNCNTYHDDTATRPAFRWRALRSQSPLNAAVSDTFKGVPRWPGDLLYNSYTRHELLLVAAAASCIPSSSSGAHSALRAAAAARSTLRQREGTTLMPADASCCSNSGWLHFAEGGEVRVSWVERGVCRGWGGMRCPNSAGWVVQTACRDHLPACTGVQRSRRRSPDAALQPHAVRLQGQDVVEVLQTGRT